MYGPCSGNSLDKQEDREDTKYIEKCCLDPKEHTLTCRDSEQRGWRGGSLEIQGQLHCHDFVGHTARRKLKVFRMNMKYNR